MTETIEWIISFLIITGSLFMLIAALGIIKLKDIYGRIHAITKASSFGITLLTVSVMIFIPTVEAIVGGGLVVLFIISTTPISSHMIARVAHRLGIPLDKGAVMDELVEEDDTKEFVPDK